jgi:phospholipid-translocating P-type ATPase (flippase)
MTINVTNQKKQYKFEIDNNYANKNHRTNKISTTKYNIITFLPKALLFQFFRLANVYFLIIAIVQSLKVISPLNPATSVTPLVFVITVSLIREAIEDYMRYRFDKTMNSEVVTVYRGGRWVEAKSESLHVGEIVFVHEDTPFPADLIILDSSLPEGITFIETGTLDGEKAPKFKTAVKDTAGLFGKNGEYRTDFSVKGECIANEPDQNLYYLQANFTIKFSSASNTLDKTIPMDAKQLLLKGAILRSTKWIIGFVVYAGHNTKLIKNSGQSRVKYSRIETLMSRLLITILFLQMVFCLVSAGLNNAYYKSFVVMNPYLPPPEVGVFTDSVISYFSYLLLLQTMIPISLIISLELTKIAQGFFMSWDVDMYSHVRNVFVKPGSISLNEELGQVNFIFSDKTGTLTRNKMVLKYVVIGDVCYEYNNLNGGRQGKRDMRIYGDGYFQKYANRKEITADKTKFENFILKSDYNEKVTLNLENEANMIEEFWKALSLCHECNINEKEGKEVYTGESPDEIELVRASAVQGFVNKKSTLTSIRKLTIAGELKEFEILKFFEFSSERKRSSVIVRDNGIIKMYTKGADVIISGSFHKDNRKDIHEQVRSYVNDFSLQGFRCLYVAMKIFDEEEYNELCKEFETANLNMENKEEEVNKVTKKFEDGIHLLGGTIVEDKLQDDVPETIRDLRLAGIKIWMITGDKIDTAFNIGLSCNLISYDLENFKIEGEKGVFLDDLEEKFEQFSEKHKAKEVLPPYSVLIDAIALDNIINPKRVCNKRCCVEHCGQPICHHQKQCDGTCYEVCETYKYDFARIAYGAATIICSRVNAEQKAQVVRLIKNYDRNATTLSIGDGNNDVKMINEAHIGKLYYLNHRHWCIWR